MASDKFRFTQMKSKALRSTSPAFAGIQFGTDLLSTLVQCEKCEYTWLSGRSTEVGAFVVLLNDYRFTCPNCGVTEDISSSEFYTRP